MPGTLRQNFHKIVEMKIEITSVNVCIPLTSRQWTILRRREDAHDNRTEKYVFYPDTWDFPNKDNVFNWEWNGHFGRNIFFTAKAGAEKDVLVFLKKLLK